MFGNYLPERFDMSKQIHVGAVAVGGGAPVTIQSMCNTPTADVEATVAQIHALEDAGCGWGCRGQSKPPPQP